MGPSSSMIPHLQIFLIKSTHAVRVERMDHLKERFQLVPYLTKNISRHACLTLPAIVLIWLLNGIKLNLDFCLQLAPFIVQTWTGDKASRWDNEFGDVRPIGCILSNLKWLSDILEYDFKRHDMTQWKMTKYSALYERCWCSNLCEYVRIHHQWVWGNASNFQLRILTETTNFHWVIF